MRLIVGLGNPGQKYEKTRHNVGFVVVDMLVGKINAPKWTKSKKFEAEYTKKEDIVFEKPSTYMNKSGRAVKKIKDHYKVDFNNIWIIHDDLDIPLGEYKIQKSKGPRSHNGVDSIEELLGGQNFWRVRVGVDNRKEERTSGEKYVLQKFDTRELVVIDNITDKIADDLIGLLEK